MSRFGNYPENSGMRKARLRKVLHTAIYYIFETGNADKKIHIRTPRGTLCKMQNADGYAIDRLNGISKEMPEGMELCRVCEQKKKELIG